MFWQKKNKPNPFDFTKPVADPNQFFGREKLVRSIMGYLQVGQSVSIQGPAKIGKTSLLQHVSHPEVLKAYGLDPVRFLFVHLDCRALADTDRPRTFRAIGRQIALQAKAQKGIEVEYGSDFQKLRQETQQLKHNGVLPILMFDHFDTLAENKKITHDFLVNLRALANSSVTYLIASEQNLVALEATRVHDNMSGGSPFANIFISSYLKPLSFDESKTVLQEKFQQIDPLFPQPNEDDLQRMLATQQGREPYRLQWLGHQLVAHWYQRNDATFDLFGAPLGPYLRQRPYLNLDGQEQLVNKQPIWERLLQAYPHGVAVASLLLVLLLVIGQPLKWWGSGAGAAIAIATLILFALSDSRPITFQKGQVSWSFLFIFIFLLLPEPMGDPPALRVWQAVLVIFVGSVGSELLRQRQAHLSKQRSILRLFFYIGHHAIAGFTAAWVYIRCLSWEPGLGFLSRADLPLIPVALVVYAVIYTAVSYIIMWPYDRAIFRLLGDVNETSLPRLNFFTLIVTLPLPLAISLLLTSHFSVWIVLLLALFTLFLYLIGSYPQIEEEAIRLRKLEALNRKLGAPPDMNALGDAIRKILDSEGVPYEWGAVYSSREVSENDEQPVYYLRNVLGRDMEGSQIIHYDPRWNEKGQLVAVGGKRPFSQTIHWPKVIALDEPSDMSQLLQVGNDAVIVRGDGTIQDADSAPYIPPQTFALYVPLRAQKAAPNGLIALAAPRRFDRTVQQQVKLLTEAVYNKVKQIQPIEARLHELFTNAEDYTPDRDKFHKTIEILRKKEVDVFLILDLIMDETFRSDVLTVMRNFTQQETKRSQNKIQMSPQVLQGIYEKALRQNPKMPTLDDQLLSELQELPASLTMAFSFRYQWPRISRSTEYEPIYAFLVQAMEAKEIADVVALRERGEPTGTLTQLRENAFPHQEILAQLKAVEKLVGQFGEVTQETLLQEINQQKAATHQIIDPERFLFSALLDHWHQLVFRPIAEKEQSSSRSDANLVIELRHQRALPLTPVTVGLRIKNIGEGAAFQLAVVMLPSDDTKPTGQQPPVERWLPPQQTIDLNFSLSLLASQRSTIPLAFQISYQDRRSRVLDFKNSLILDSPTLPYRSFNNPYSPGSPLAKESLTFVGREDIVGFINATVGSVHARQRVLLLTGERRIGKTSLLKRLPLLVTDYRYIHVLFDCQMLGSYIDDVVFCRRLAREIQTAVHETGFALEPLPNEAWSPDPFTTLEHEFLNRIWEVIGDHMLLISIDEFDQLDRLVGQDIKISSADIARPLRGLMQSQPRLTFIFSSKKQLEEIDPGWSQLLNMGQRKTIGFLRQADAVKLITEPVAAFITYDELSLAEIYSSTAGHPYFTQLICDKLINMCIGRKQSFVTVYDVHQALTSIVAERPNHLADLWREFGQRERDVLGALLKAQLDHRPATVATLADILAEAEREYSLTAVRAALQNLEHNKQIVTRTELHGTGYYDFSMKLYHYWIRKYHSLN